MRCLGQNYRTWGLNFSLSVANGALASPSEGPGSSGGRNGKCVNRPREESFLLQWELVGVSGSGCSCWAALEMSSEGWRTKSAASSWMSDPSALYVGSECIVPLKMLPCVLFKSKGCLFFRLPFLGCGRGHGAIVELIHPMKRHLSVAFTITSGGHCAWYKAEGCLYFLCETVALDACR